jgi:hypothetical protein
MLPWNELEYSAGPVKKMKALQSRFTLERDGEPVEGAAGSQKD